MLSNLMFVEFGRLQVQKLHSVADTGPSRDVVRLQWRSSQARLRGHHL